jgi:LAS superfamily LD-carboxypeptidase LdcB
MIRVRFLFFSLCVFVSLQESTAQAVDKKYLLGKFEPASDGRFVKIADLYGKGSAKGGYLRKEAYDAFVKMAEAAKKDGVNLYIISATRNFHSQKTIWENKWNGNTMVEGKNLTTVENLEERAKLILLYSSMPSTSRHHWGTDMDLNSLNNDYFLKGDGLRIYEWLTAHAASFGFCQPYTTKADGKRTGYEEEKWHWSYLPLSSVLLREYQSAVTYDDIAGFQGSDVARNVKMIENYVNGVACK